MTEFQAQDREDIITPERFKNWATSQRIDLRGKSVFLFYETNDRTKIDTLIIEPDIPAADVTKILTQFPYLRQGKVPPRTTTSVAPRTP